MTATRLYFATQILFTIVGCAFIALAIASHHNERDKFVVMGSTALLLAALFFLANVLLHRRMRARQ
jgi:drug/metabolite transporter (DMT)-like permease